MNVNPASEESRKHLSRAAFFSMVATELFRKGNLTEQENILLARLVQFLKLDPKQARAVAQAVRNCAARDRVPPAPNATVLYARVLRSVLSLGQLAERDTRMLEALRRLTSVPDTAHDQLLTALSTTARPAVAAPAPAEPPRASMVDQLSELVGKGDFPGVESLLSGWALAHHKSEGFAKAYDRAFETCVEAAIKGQDLCQVAHVVTLARKLACAMPSAPHRWETFGRLVCRATTLVAKATRWDLHADLMLMLTDVPDAGLETIAPAKARAFVSAIEENLQQSRFDDALRWHGVLGQMEYSSPTTVVRPAKAAAVSSTIRILAGLAPDVPLMAQASKALAQMTKACPGDPDIVRAVTSCIEPWIQTMMARHDASALKEILSEVQNIARSLPKDEEVALELARSLVKSAIWWKDRAEKDRLNSSMIVRFLGACSRKGDPILAELHAVVQTLVAIHPFSDRMADVRRRFEGLTGQKIRVGSSERVTAVTPHLARSAA